VAKNQSPRLPKSPHCNARTSWRTFMPIPAPRSVPDFQEHQRTSTDHIRDPKQNRRPTGVPARRMKVYNDPLFNNVFGQISSCFPVARSVLGKRKWQRLVRQFFATHRCRTPYFRQTPEEFLQSIQQRGSLGSDPDFLIYLLHYEWVELAVDISGNETDISAIDPAGADRCGTEAPESRIRTRRWTGCAGEPSPGRRDTRHICWRLIP